jgi:hypothetical protein
MGVLSRYNKRIDKPEANSKPEETAQRRYRTIDTDSPTALNQYKTDISSEDLKVISNLYESALKEENWHAGKWLKTKMDLENLLNVFRKYNIKSNYDIIHNLYKEITRDSKTYSKLQLKIDDFKHKIKMFEIKFNYTPDEELYDIESEWGAIGDQVDDLNAEARPIGERLVENRKALREVLIEVLPQLYEQLSNNQMK